MTILVFVQDLGQFRILPVSPAPAIFCDVGTWLLWISIILFTKFHKIPPRSHLKDSLARVWANKPRQAGCKIPVCPRLVIYIVRRNLKQLLYFILFSYWMRSITWRNSDQRVESQTFLILSPIPNAEAIFMFILMFIKNLLHH